ncbi:MAG: DUF308 domain-containing protein [Terriglobales bacterium]
MAGKEDFRQEHMPDRVPLFGFEHLRYRWSAQLGLALVLLGTLALITAGSAGAPGVMLVGWLVVASGVVEAIHAFSVHKCNEFFLHVMPGIAGVPVGLLIATHSGAGALAWMLVFACFFTIVGVFRAISAIRLKFPNWGWSLFDGVVTALLGLVMWVGWSWLGVWFFGVAAGISLILRGWSAIMFALGMRRRDTLAGRVCRACGSKNDVAAKRCAACGAELDAAPKPPCTRFVDEDPALRYVDPNNRIELGRYWRAADAELACGLLRSNGIPCELSSMVLPELPADIILWVPNEHAKKAWALLADTERQASTTDEDAA